MVDFRIGKWTRIMGLLVMGVGVDMQSMTRHAYSVQAYVSHREEKMGQ